MRTRELYAQIQGRDPGLCDDNEPDRGHFVRSALSNLKESNRVFLDNGLWKLRPVNSNPKPETYKVMQTETGPNTAPPNAAPPNAAPLKSPLLSRLVARTVLEKPQALSAPPNRPLNEIGITELVGELFARGSQMKNSLEAIAAAHKQVKACAGNVATCAEMSEDALRKCAADTSRELTQLAASAKSECQKIAQTILQEGKALAQNTETTCLSRVQTLETECLSRVETAEANCRALVASAVEECGKRADAAESEALRCIDQADKATAAANTLGTAFNALNDRLHNIEISFRTIFSSGAGSAAAPVYPVSTPPAVLPTPPVPPAPPQPKQREDTTIKMQFVLFGLHQKEGEKIRQKLRYATARHSSITIIESTLDEALPQHADYAIISGHLELGSRWKYCLNFYGPSKCVRLETGSIQTFRQKIEDLYEARYPASAPLNPMNNALRQVAAH